MAITTSLLLVEHAAAICIYRLRRLYYAGCPGGEEHKRAHRPRRSGQQPPSCWAHAHHAMACSSARNKAAAAACPAPPAAAC